MHYQESGDCFESMRSLNQALSFEATEKEFQLRNVEFGAQQMRSQCFTTHPEPGYG